MGIDLGGKCTAHFSGNCSSSWDLSVIPLTAWSKKGQWVGFSFKQVKEKEKAYICKNISLYKHCTFQFLIIWNLSFFRRLHQLVVLFNREQKLKITICYFHFLSNNTINSSEITVSVNCDLSLQERFWSITLRTKMFSRRQREWDLCSAGILFCKATRYVIKYAKK